MEKRKQTAICGVCPGGCAVEVTVEKGKLVDLAALKGGPYAALCVRGKHAPEVVYSTDRLRKPLIRAGERGKGEFREATWEEALDFAAERMKIIREKDGPQALASHSGRGGFEQSVVDFTGGGDTVSSKLLWPFGSPNAASVSSVCFTSFGVLAPMTTMGLLGKRLEPDLENSKLIIFWGTNPATDSPPFMFERLIKAQQEGTRVIAIDHMQSDIAQRADQWLAVRPGTDGALALGLLQVIIEEELYDKEFVERWTIGFAELKEYVRAFQPRRVEEITGVPGVVVKGLARELATTKNTALRTYTGLEYSNCGVQSIRAVYILWAITGNLDVPGGLLINPVPKSPMEPVQLSKPGGVLPIGASKYPLFYELTGCAQFMEFPKAVLEGDPYPIKGLLINGASILTSYPQPHIWAESLQKLEFLLVIDRFMTKDALYADVVLPATTYFENTSYQRYPGYVRLRRPVIKPLAEARNDLFIIAALAERLGYGHLFPQNEKVMLKRAFAGDPEQLKKLLQAEDGLALPRPERQYQKYAKGLLRSDGQVGFETPSGKLEITSSLLAKHGYDSLPVYVEPLEGKLGSSELFKEYPLTLNTGARIQSTFRSQHLNIPGLLKLQDKPRVLINSEDAAAKGIKEEDRVVIRTLRGSVDFYAKVTDRIPKGVVEVNVGGGGPIGAEAWQEANANVLTDFHNRDPISGFPVFKALLCEIEKASD